MAEQQQTEATIPNGEEIVERFGGIRPMAAKLEVPVTTVQGWKKRDAIPVSRRDDIINAAGQYNINLKGLVSDLPIANQNARIEEDPALRTVSSSSPAPAARPITSARSEQSASSDHIDLRAIRRSARTTSLLTSASLCVILGALGFALFGGDAHHQQTEINSLQNRVSNIEAQQPAPSGLPAGLDATISDLQGKVQSITNALGASDLANGSASIVQRLNALEQQLSGNPALAATAQQMQNMATNPMTAGSWQAAVDELRGIVTGLQGRMDQMDSALNAAKSQNDALSSTLSNVTGRDLSAAAMLLALTQLRTAVDRQAPFADDLALLRDVAASSDPALAASIDKMAPYAQTGVMSPEALKKQLQGLSNDIITAKLKGEDVSLKDRIMARLQGLFTLKKDGMPITGGQEREMIARASTQLDNNDVAGAMATLQQLQGPAAEVAAPWQSQAQATLAVQSIDAQLVSSLMGRIRGMASGATAPIDLSTPSAPQAQVQQPQLEPQPAPQQPSVTIQQ